MGCLTVPSLVLVGGGEIIHGLKRLQCMPVYADAPSHLPGPSVIQLFAVMEKSGTNIISFYYYFYTMV